MKKFLITFLIIELLFLGGVVLAQNWGSWDLWFLDGTSIKTFSGTDNLDMESGNITTTGLGTFGNLDVDTLNFNDNEITDSTGAISFGDEDIGIGVAVPLAKLHVVDEIRIGEDGTPGALKIYENDGSGRLELKGTGDQEWTMTTGGSNADATLLFAANGAGVFTTSFDGSVGIADTTPDSALEVVSGGSHYFMASSREGGDGNVFIIDSSGNIGIGVSDPAQALEIVGSLELENTSSATTGVIYKEGVSYIHNFRHPTGNTAQPVGRNMFLGKDAGNFTMGSTATATYHGSNNLGFGETSLHSLTIGDANVALGYQSSYYGESITGNIAIGKEAMKNNITGDTNVAIGTQSGKGVLDSSNINDNVLIGHQTGYSLLTGGNENVFIGYKTGKLVTTGNNDILIGHEIEPPTTTTDYYLSIGDIIKGDMTSGSEYLWIPLDNQELYFGAGLDASILYDDTDLWIDTDNVGTGSLKIGDATNYMEVKIDGELRLHGTARIKRHLYIWAPAFKKLGNVDPDAGWEGLFSTFDFDKTAEQEIYFTINVPYRWDDTTDVNFHILWEHETNQADDTKKVVWGIEYIAIAEGEVLDGATSTTTEASAGSHNVDAGKRVDTEFTTGIPYAGLADHDQIGLRIYRDATSGDDDLDEDAKMMGIHVEFTENKLGQEL